MAEADQIQRTVLPIPDRPYEGLVTYDAKDPDTSFPPIEPLRPPERAPNVLVILLDDVGFGASSAFGGPCATPTAERLADRGHAPQGDEGRLVPVRPDLLPQISARRADGTAGRHLNLSPGLSLRRQVLIRVETA